MRREGESNPQSFKTEGFAYNSFNFALTGVMRERCGWKQGYNAARDGGLIRAGFSTGSRSLTLRFRYKRQAAAVGKGGEVGAEPDGRLARPQHQGHAVVDG